MSGFDDDAFSRPKWAREIDRFLAIKPQFLLYGNVNDVFPAPLAGGVATLTLPDYLRELLTDRGTVLTVKYEPLAGFSLLFGDGELFRKLTGHTLAAGGVLPATLERAAEIVAALTGSGLGHTAV
ncbi:MAG: hypothetical protein LBT15_02935, partial [Synergistaceae bacterium]|nr:hypothetical protein [Synergistaceae bacterium]